jgi:hypothetical protein
VSNSFDDSSVNNLEFVGLVTGNEGSGAMIGALSTTAGFVAGFGEMIGALSTTAEFVAGFFDGNSEFVGFVTGNDGFGAMIGRLSTAALINGGGNVVITGGSF